MRWQPFVDTLCTGTLLAAFAVCVLVMTLTGCAGMQSPAPLPAVSAPTPPWIGDRTRYLEGIILYPDDSWISANMMNCQPQVASDAEFSETALYTRLPEPGHGPVSQAFCRYHARDPQLWESPGDWVVTTGKCTKTCSTARATCLADADCPAGGTCIAWAAVATRTQYDRDSGGGDAGCDSVGLLPTTPLPSRPVTFGPPAIVVKNELCHSTGTRTKCRKITGEQARHLRQRGRR